MAHLMDLLRSSTRTKPAADKRHTGTEAGYVELPGAKKDADCMQVRVAGGVSSRLGCCNEFEYDPELKKDFSCGSCEYVEVNRGTS